MRERPRTAAKERKDHKDPSFVFLALFCGLFPYDWRTEERSGPRQTDSYSAFTPILLGSYSGPTNALLASY